MPKLKALDEPTKAVAKKKDPILDRVLGFYQESNAQKAGYEYRWQKNLKLYFGIWSDEKASVSRVRQMNKTFFRKIWAVIWRLVAVFYSSFLQDPDNVTVEGRDNLNDWAKAGVLQQLFLYRRDKMYREQSLFLKHIWAFQDILNHGYCAGKLFWEYNPKNKKDGPRYVLFPPEQVYPDFSAETPDEMRFIIFESYMTKEDLEAEGYENIKDAKPMSVPNNAVRNLRFYRKTDPMTAKTDNTYPARGSSPEDGPDSTAPSEMYVVWETLIKKPDGLYSVITNKDECVLRKERKLPYDILPVVMGQCLTIAHRLVGEGMAEPLEGPQESYNFNLNARKDNVALNLNAPTLVSRFANADLNALVNARAGGIVLADEIDGIKKLEQSDVTRSSYSEAEADDWMMQEMSGVTQTKQGTSTAEKATVAQLNYMESNEKLNVFVALVCETYWRQFNYLLVRLIATFETDDKVIRIANENWQGKESTNLQIYVDDFEDFDADIIINAGPPGGKAKEIQDTLLAMDRAIMANQQIVQMAQAQLIPADQLRIVNVGALIEDLLPKIGKRGTGRYFVKLKQPPAQPPQGGAPGTQEEAAIEGEMVPQMGETEAALPGTNPDLKIPGLPNFNAA